MRLRMHERMQQIQARAEVWWTLAALVVVEQIADILSTLAALRAGAGEANRLSAYLLAHGGWPLLIGAKPLLALALGGLLLAFAATPGLRRSRVGLLALGVASVGVLAYALILGNNLADWLILTHALPWQ